MDNYVSLLQLLKLENDVCAELSYYIPRKEAEEAEWAESLESQIQMRESFIQKWIDFKNQRHLSESILEDINKDIAKYQSEIKAFQEKKAKTKYDTLQEKLDEVRAQIREYIEINIMNKEDKNNV